MKYGPEMFVNKHTLFIHVRGHINTRESKPYFQTKFISSNNRVNSLGGAYHVIISKLLDGVAISTILINAYYFREEPTCAV